MMKLIYTFTYTDQLQIEITSSRRTKWLMGESWEKILRTIS